MPGTAQTDATLEVGTTCIIHVDEVNSPKGWWFGVVDKIVDHGTYREVTAHITGEFRLNANWRPIYTGEVNQKDPYLNYTVYPDNESTRSLVNTLRLHIADVTGKNHRLHTQLSELRELIRGMFITPDQLVSAVREAMKT